MAWVVGQATYLQLVRRPVGVPGREDWELVSAPLAEPGEGEALVENRFLSVDPYMRGRMDDVPSYYPPWPLRAPLDGDAVGMIAASRDPELPEGAWVASEHGLRDRFVAPAAELRPLAAPPAGLDHSCYLDLLGGTGFTAFLGVEILAPQVGETVFVSTAAGAVGSVAAQICRAAGARTIGSTGSAEKARLSVERYGYDAVFDYSAEPAAAALDRLAPEGIDGFFDNVGGEQLEAAIERMRVGGRIAKCGAIAGYNSAEPPAGPRNLHHFFGRRLTMVGFLVSDHRERRPEFEQRMREWVESGEVRGDQRRFQGLEEIPDAFLDLFAGGNVGKTVVALEPADGGAGKAEGALDPVEGGERR
jgi:NADPH-dependent curcumin reductase CurA